MPIAINFFLLSGFYKIREIEELFGFILFFSLLKRSAFHCDGLIGLTNSSLEIHFSIIGRVVDWSDGLGMRCLISVLFGIGFCFILFYCVSDD